MGTCVCCDMVTMVSPGTIRHLVTVVLVTRTLRSASDFRAVLPAQAPGICHAPGPPWSSSCSPSPQGLTALLPAPHPPQTSTLLPGADLLEGRPHPQPRAGPPTLVALGLHT